MAFAMYKSVKTDILRDCHSLSEKERENMKKKTKQFFCSLIRVKKEMPSCL